MSDLTDHQRKAGRTVTARKSAASRGNLDKAREGIKAKRELRLRYVEALEGLAGKVRAANLPRTISNSGIHAAAATVEQVRKEMEGKK